MATITKTLNIALQSLQAIRVGSQGVGSAQPAQSPSAAAAARIAAAQAGKAGAAVAAPAPAAPDTSQPGFQLVLAVSDSTSSALYARKVLFLLNGALTEGRGKALGDCPPSLQAAIDALKDEVSKLVDSLQASGKISF